tara:strand:- start:208 stop:657 length:450 start_codon:yes stop_codon:yes gene_type:complete
MFDDKPNQILFNDLIQKINNENCEENIASYLSDIYEKFGYYTHNKVIDELQLKDYNFTRKGPTNDIFWSDHTENYEYYKNLNGITNLQNENEYKEMIYRIYCLRIIYGGVESHDAIINHFETIKHNYDMIVLETAILVLGFEEEWLDIV